MVDNDLFILLWVHERMTLDIRLYNNDLVVQYIVLYSHVWAQWNK